MIAFIPLGRSGLHRSHFVCCRLRGWHTGWRSSTRCTLLCKLLTQFWRIGVVPNVIRAKEATVLVRTFEVAFALDGPIVLPNGLIKQHANPIARCDLRNLTNVCDFSSPFTQIHDDSLTHLELCCEIGHVFLVHNRFGALVIICNAPYVWIRCKLFLVSL